MADWSLLEEWPPDLTSGAYDANLCPYPHYLESQQCQLPASTMPPPPPPPQPPPKLPLHLPQQPPQPRPQPQAQPEFKVPQIQNLSLMPHRGAPVRYNDFAMPSTSSAPTETPRELRNRAEKQRRDKLNQTIAELASMVPPVTASNRKIDKTGVLRLTAHYLRAHQYVFGDAINEEYPRLSEGASNVLLGLLNGFLLTITYKGLLVVVSQNIKKYLGYSELELLGSSIYSIIHPEDHSLLRELMIPRPNLMGPHGELLVPEDATEKEELFSILQNEKRVFSLRIKKFSQRSEPVQYVSCDIEGSFRKSDRACRGNNRCCQMVRRARARGDNPCASGNDVVFICIVRPTFDTFRTETGLEAFKMEYRTRHSVDGMILQSEQRMALVTGYMTNEVTGVNAMNFMHRDDVRWVIIALREMYDKHRLFGESCYRLMTKNGEFIYMRTRGRLDVDKGQGSVTSFVCTNTVVGEQEGKHLIRMMKRKFTKLLYNTDEVPPMEDIKITNEGSTLPVEDPRRLEKVILHLVTNLPSSRPVAAPNISQYPGFPHIKHLAIIPPRREKIIKAVARMYNVMKWFYKDPRTAMSYTYQERKETEFMPIQSHSTHTQTDKSDIIKLSSSRNVYLRQPTPLVSDLALAGHSNPRPSTSGLYTGTTMKLTREYQQMGQETKIKYHLMVAPDVPTEYSRNRIEEVTSPQPGPSGVKRPIESADVDSALSKKKTSEPMLFNDDVDYGLEINNTAVDNYFNESFYNSQQLPEIDTTLDSLDQIIDDPTFPELLISKEIQDIIGEIERDQDNT